MKKNQIVHPIERKEKKKKKTNRIRPKITQTKWNEICNERKFKVHKYLCTEFHFFFPFWTIDRQTDRQKVKIVVKTECY